MDLINIIDTSLCNMIMGAKNFYIIQNNNMNIEINLDNVLLPFGSEKYNDKIIINIELENNNINNNIISKLTKLEVNILNCNINMNSINKNILKNKGILSIIKNSKLGNIIRTHLLKNTEIFILKKNGEKINIDHTNLVNSECDIKLDLKGIWLNDNNYGLYITIKSIKINKFN
jgi:hypothetical protein